MRTPLWPDAAQFEGDIPQTSHSKPKWWAHPKQVTLTSQLRYLLSQGNWNCGQPVPFLCFRESALLNHLNGLGAHQWSHNVQLLARGVFTETRFVTRLFPKSNVNWAHQHLSVRRYPVPAQLSLPGETTALSTHFGTERAPLPPRLNYDERRRPHPGTPVLSPTPVGETKTCNTEIRLWKRTGMLEASTRGECGTGGFLHPVRCILPIPEHTLCWPWVTYLNLPDSRDRRQWT